MSDETGTTVGCFLVSDNLGGIADGYEAFVSGPRYMEPEAVIRYARKYDKTITLDGERWSAVGATPGSRVAPAEAEECVERLAEIS
jgi:hypothetical protein